MTDQKRRLFIYDRKEVGVLILLGVGVALFAFTLGVHLGKQVIPKAVETAGEAKHVDPVQSTAEQAPSRVEISQEVKNVPGAVDESLDQSLRDEIAKTGLQVEKPRQVELPEQVRKVPQVKTAPPEVGAEHGETHAAEPKKVEAHGEKKSAQDTHAAAPHSANTAKSAPAKAPVTKLSSHYTLQVGSFPSLRDAEPELLKLNENGLRAEVREVEVSGKGKWFRLLVGQFESAKDAEKAGKSFKKERRIAEFVVVRAPESVATKTE